MKHSRKLVFIVVAMIIVLTMTFGISCSKKKPAAEKQAVAQQITEATDRTVLAW